MLYFTSAVLNEIMVQHTEFILSSTASFENFAKLELMSIKSKNIFLSTAFFHRNVRSRDSYLLDVFYVFMLQFFTSSKFIPKEFWTFFVVVATILHFLCTVFKMPVARNLTNLFILKSYAIN